MSVPTLENVSAKLTLFVSKQCPICPLVTEQIRALAEHNDQIELTILDVAEALDLARARGVQAVPTLLVGETLRLTGSIDADDVAQLLVNPRALSALALTRLIQKGQVDALAQLMLDHRTIFPALAELIASPTFSTRLGAMAVVERLCERDRALAAGLAEELWARFEDADDNVRGDLLYLVGEIGARQLLPNVEAVAQGNYRADVREAALDAIELLHGGPR